jgi:hypothetical protein
MTKLKTIELEYRPLRNGGEDQLHNHLSFKPSNDEREACGACAQLANDFTWLRFNDAIAGVSFADKEEVLAQARIETTQKLASGDLRAFRDQALVA